MTQNKSPAAAAAPALNVEIVAGEESGDRLGAALIQALLRQHQGPMRLSGVGGHHMAAQGLPSRFAIDELSLIGFTAIPQRLPGILRRIRETAAAIIAAQPDVLVLIDSPDFSHRVAKRVRAAMPSIPIVDYVSPSVWAWRPGRARAMRRYVDHVLAILPFEPAVHARLGGPPCSYVGHPLMEQVSLLRPDETEARQRALDPPILLVLPGSRRGEVLRLNDAFAKAAALVLERCGPIDLVLPTVPHVQGLIEKLTAAWPVRPRIVVDSTEKHTVFRRARAALAASGTVTLELALAGVPTVAAYRVSSIEAVVARAMIRVPSVLLPNLILGENVVPEFLQEDCVPERLAQALATLIQDGGARSNQLNAFARLDQIMELHAAAPSDRAAQIVLATARQHRPMLAQAS